ncbi:MAG: adenylate kinase family protein [Oligoflexales bacterium]
MIVVMTGAPGAGKGTQAELMETRLGFRKISTGDVLRKNIKNGTPIGKKAEAIVASGKLVGDDILKDIVNLEMQKPTESLLLDGYPRNVHQSQDLEAIKGKHDIKIALHIDVPVEILVRRLTGRRICGECGTVFHVDDNPPAKAGVCDRCSSALTQRPDDKEEKIRVRLDVYERETRPVLDFYQKQGKYVKINGVGTTDEVYGRIVSCIEKLN